MNRVRIKAIAPTRIDLAGGTLDIWPLYLFHEGALTLNVAIGLYARCVIETGGRGIRLRSRDTARREQFASLAALQAQRRYRLPLLAELVKYFQPRDRFALTTDSQAPAGAGIGGSSALAVALCAALDRLTGFGGHRVDWIHISRDVECKVLGVPTGTQDHYPAAFGGVAAIHLETGGERRERLRTDVDALERRLVLCYTGKPRRSGINNWEVTRAHIEGDRRVWRNLEHIAQVARAMKSALERQDWNEVGRLMRVEWEFRRRNLPTIATPVMDRILAAAHRQGAQAGKVCGAGGGGCLVLLIEPEARARVEAAVAQAGGMVLPVRIDRQGVRLR
ncbi:MAG: GHMP kinase [Firmicutes bacterium]|nr:GHMP kinase [Bacillota bacterium]